jgi:hypothetical protein
MPERNVMEIGEDHDLVEVGRWIIRYSCPLAPETGRLLNMQDNDTLVGTVHALRDEKGRILTPVGKEFRFSVERLGSTPTEFLYYVRLPSEVVEVYGVREHECVDATFSAIERSGMQGVPVPVFPAFYRWGRMDVRPAEEPSPSQRAQPVALVEHVFSDSLFSQLAAEINEAYSLGLRRAALVMFRTLLQSLLVDLLRALPGIPVDHFYDGRHARFRDLATLIEYAKKATPAIQPYGPTLDVAFLDSLHEFRRTANETTHVLEFTPPPEFFAAKKAEMNDACDRVARACAKLGHPI